jgi:hypothetical protein
MKLVLDTFGVLLFLTGPRLYTRAFYFFRR